MTNEEYIKVYKITYSTAHENVDKSIEIVKELIKDVDSYREKLKKEDIDSILKTQKEQLEEVSKFVKNDGLREYAVFTYSRKETTKIIKEFTLNHPEFELICDRQIFANDVPSDGLNGFSLLLFHLITLFK